MPNPLTVALVTTADPRRPGSMRVYANMVQQVVTEQTNDICFITTDLVASMPQWSWVPNRLSQRFQLLWLIATAKHRLTRVQADVYHLVDGSYAHVLQGFNQPNTVVTVHDLIPALQAERRFNVAPPGKWARWLIARTLHNLKQQQFVCTVSVCTKNDLRKYLGHDPDIITIHSGLRDSILAHLPDTLPTWKQRSHHNGSRTILHIGNNGFYKNRLAVLETFSRLLPNERLYLVMAGAPPDESLRQHIQTLEIPSTQIEFINYPEDEEISKLYEKASILLFPSHYEGFGWPPLEAMAFGCPVVCANTGSLPEVVGKAALMADPTDYSGLAKQCKTLLHSTEQAERMIELGYQNIKRFSRSQMADRLIDLYREAAQRND